MLVSSNKRYATLAPLILLTIWLWVLLDRPYTLPTHLSWNIYSNTPLTPPLTDLFQTPPLSLPSLRHLCAATPFPPKNPSNLSPIFVCDENYGGIVEVRNSILHCVRFAIAAGAGGLVLPRIVVRDEGDGDPISRDMEEMDYLFDEESFLKGLGKSCPSLKVWRNVRVVPDVRLALGPVKLERPWEIVGGGEGVERWGERFEGWLEAKVAESGVNVGEDVERIVIVELGCTFLQWPIYNDGVEIAEGFGGLLNFDEKIRKLATTVLMRMAEKYRLSQDLENPILKQAFMGAVLTTKGEELSYGVMVDQSTSSYESQARIYFSQAVHANLSLIYATSDQKSNLEQFIREGSEQNIVVTNKFDLLTSDEKSELLEWTGDQQQAVDLLVMEKASEIAGAGHSGLAWHLALKRHRLAAMRKHLEGPLMMNDELSRIYGQVGTNPQFAACLWP